MRAFKVPSARQVRGVTDAGLTPRRIKRIAVLGGGLMGSGIATASILAGVGVLLKEVNAKFLEVRRPPACSHRAERPSAWPCGPGAELVLDLTLAMSGIACKRRQRLT